MRGRVNRSYLAALDAPVQAAHGRLDVGPLGGGMEALASQAEHLVAELEEEARVGSQRGTASKGALGKERTHIAALVWRLAVLELEEDDVYYRGHGGVFLRLCVGVIILVSGHGWW